MSHHMKKDTISHATTATTPTPTATATNSRQRKQQQQHYESNNKNHKKQTPNGNIKTTATAPPPISNSNNNNSNNIINNKNSSSSCNSVGKMSSMVHLPTPPTSSTSTSTSSVNSSSSRSSSNSNTFITTTQQCNINKSQQCKKDKHQKDKERAERAQLVLWRQPMRTFKYCAFELIALLRSWSRSLLEQRGLLAVLIVLSIVFSITYKIEGPHQLIIDYVRRNTWFFVYWVGLGVLSSVGLGTGLHTFLLYLGPHIASVTLAAYECNSVSFPQPPYPDDIICPEEPYVRRVPNLWAIMSKVRLEAFLWGAGTALGELPPYFMAKAARLSGYDPDEDDEELAEFEALKAKRNQKNLSLMDKGKLFMERVVERVGFFGILACASIPNPLFDLAGITCGHFLVPFWTFFGATLIGKAIIKMHIQKIFVIIAFNETLIERAVDLIAALPIVGRRLQQPFKAFLENQKQRLHRQQHGNNKSTSGHNADSGNLLSKIFETFVICMVCYFVVSIVNSLAQSYHKRLHKKKPLKRLTTIATSTSTSTSGNLNTTTTQRKQLKHKAVRD